MLSPLAGQIALVVYAVLLAVGGVIGYTKAASRPSLIAGLASALAALLAFALSFRTPSWNGCGFCRRSALVSLFGYRFAVKTRKFMPSGLLALVSLAVLAVVLLVLI